jgi:L-ascorbate metabolism protein UlaG (beta-lactamase superfamily)
MTLFKRAEKSGRKFLNPIPTTVGGQGMIFKVLPLFLKNREQTEPKTPLGPFHTDPTLYANPPASGLRVTWFGHSCSLLEIDGFRILIDPVWEQRAGPVSFFGPRRFFQPTIELRDLPPIDVVLVSHDHYDHLGAHTIRALASLPNTASARWVTSLGVGKRLRDFGVPSDRTIELDWTESTELAAGLKITAWPARHFSGRGLHDRFTTLWSSFVIEGHTHRVYFGADSGWWDGLPDIAAHYPGFDLTMLEIGAFHPLWADIHLGPDNAARAFASMGPRAGLFMPIHWGLFNLALHAWDQPIKRIEELSAAQRLPVWSPQPGLPTEVVAGMEHRSPWWK